MSRNYSDYYNGIKVGDRLFHFTWQEWYVLRDISANTLFTFVKEGGSEELCTTLSLCNNLVWQETRVLDLDNPPPRPRWRAKINGEYWYLSPANNPCIVLDERHTYDNMRWLAGNYFRDKYDAEAAAEEVAAEINRVTAEVFERRMKHEQ